MKFNIIINMINIIICIVIKPGLEVDPAKGPSPGFHGSTRKIFKK
jgi:hypothetical protein